MGLLNSSFLLIIGNYDWRRKDRIMFIPNVKPTGLMSIPERKKEAQRIRSKIKDLARERHNLLTRPRGTGGHSQYFSVDSERIKYLDEQIDHLEFKLERIN